jgi:hypothetical protein
MSTFKSLIKIPPYPKQSESFNHRLGGFFRECWERMRVMHAEFEYGQLVDSTRSTEGTKATEAMSSQE